MATRRIRAPKPRRKLVKVRVVKIGLTLGTPVAYHARSEVEPAILAKPEPKAMK